MANGRYWAAVGYPENMVDDWQDRIGDILQLPYAYCIHDADHNKNGDRAKTHVHVMLMWSNTTTQKSAVALLNQLSKPGLVAFPMMDCQRIISPSHIYEYLIHNTDECKKKGKFLYPESARITGNGFDIHFYEQVSETEKKAMRIELGQVILDRGFTNYASFYEYVTKNFTPEYVDVVCGNSSHFARLTKGMFQKKSGGAK